MHSNSGNNRTRWANKNSQYQRSGHDRFKDDLIVRTRQEVTILETSPRMLDRPKPVSPSTSQDEESGRIRGRMAPTISRIKRTAAYILRRIGISTNMTISGPPFFRLSMVLLPLIFLLSACAVTDAVDIVSDEIEKNEPLTTKHHTRKESLRFIEAPRSLRSDTSYSSDNSEYMRAENGWQLLSPPVSYSGDESATAGEEKMIRSTRRKAKTFTNDDSSTHRVKFYLGGGARAQPTADAKIKAKEIAEHLRTLRRLEVDIQFEICVKEGVFILESNNDVGVLQKILESSDKILTEYANSSNRLRRLESVMDDDVHTNNNDHRFRGVSSVQERNSASSRDVEDVFSERNLSSMSGSIFYTDFVAPIIDEVIDLASFTKYRSRIDSDESPRCQPYLIKAKSVVFIDWDYDEAKRDSIKRDIVKEFQVLLPDLALSDGI